MNSLEALGWSDFFERQLRELDANDTTVWHPARVTLANRGHYTILGPSLDGEGPHNGVETSSRELKDEGILETSAVISGRVRYGALERAELPTVGDWVAVRRAGDTNVIEHRFERRSSFVRAGLEGESAQVVAANVDMVFIVTSFNRDLNERRIERYLTTVWNGGANAIIVINKADLVDETRPWIDRLGPVASGVPVCPIAALDNAGVDSVRHHIGPGQTVATVGSSGVGKSTLINCLLGEERQAVRAIRSVDAKGRHTTTHRELMRLPGGGLIIDTPGMRELGVVGDDDGVGAAFADVEELAMRCRFRDCTHDDEPGCAVQAAIVRGELPSKRLGSYRKLKRELAYARRKQDANLAREERLKWKKIHVQNRKRLFKRS